MAWHAFVLAHTICPSHKGFVVLFQLLGLHACTHLIFECAVAGWNPCEVDHVGIATKIAACLSIGMVSGTFVRVVASDRAALNSVGMRFTLSLLESLCNSSDSTRWGVLASLPLIMLGVITPCVLSYFLWDIAISL